MSYFSRFGSGPKLARARRLYLSTVRMILSYACPVWYRTGPMDGLQQQLKKMLVQAQNRSLRSMTHAFKTSPIEDLQKETFVENILVYLDTRVKSTLAKSIGCDTEAEQTLSAVRAELRHRLRRVRLKALDTKRIAKIADPEDQIREIEQLVAAVQVAIPTGVWADVNKRKKAIGKAIKTQVHQDINKQWREYCREKQDQGQRRTSLYDDWGPHNLKRHARLSGMSSSVLIKLRTEWIGLKAFLHRRDVCHFPFSPTQTY
ncbi:hypothetical protein BDV95DRAFT_56911 [Massariosphaeria phaeospora]|uniref:Uncharacterized protein n=1 Tax=Massariosphaeria phaeospora TaxID=100035 RepID=A0A7C8I5B7_9PLEO|nr:hypothetical protein BDV95DRAFT_56911 [Massariosphaeria phaeospora]